MSETPLLPGWKFGRFDPIRQKGTQVIGVDPHSHHSLCRADPAVVFEEVQALRRNFREQEPIGAAARPRATDEPVLGQVQEVRLAALPDRGPRPARL